MVSSFISRFQARKHGSCVSRFLRFYSFLLQKVVDQMKQQQQILGG